MPTILLQISDLPLTNSYLFLVNLSLSNNIFGFILFLEIKINGLKPVCCSNFFDKNPILLNQIGHQMKNQKLHSYLKLHTKADVIVIQNEFVSELITFNDHVSIEKYQHFLEKKNEDAFIIYLDNLTLIKGDSTKYFKCLYKQFEDALSYFKDINGFLIHKNLVIKDKNGNSLAFEELSSELKHKISTYISSQKTSLQCFLSKLNFSDNHIPRTVLKWNGTKTDFIELATAIYEGGFITSENGSFSKKEFMEQFSNIFNLDIQFYKNLLSKAMVRENSATFTYKLNAILTEFYKRLIN